VAINHELLSGVRAKIRSGAYRGQTSGMAPGHVQGNLAILPKAWADDFLQFCHFNPKPCPVIGMTEPGDPRVPMLGADLDLRTDLPRYCVWRDGEMVEEVDDIRQFWRDDLVGFVIGCSFSFEQALIEAGIPLPHIEQGRNVAMYRTNIACRPAGRFSGPVVVSMRSMTPANAIRAIQVCSRFPNVHGAPIHFGDPAAIGIADLDRPDWGDVVEVRNGEVPVFWACGVTPQAVLRDSKPPFSITHAPGAMLITDLLNNQLAAF
jgi:uncharacterized protein YcsI (UPF0317 family)